MSLPDQTPKLPKYPFLIGDAVLLAAAWLIYDQRRHPLDGWAIAGVVACVAIAGLVGVIPFLSDYARKQDEALDDRQRGLEALSRTVNTAAEQISIAANGLNELTELTHKNLKHAEQLPQKLHEKITEFNAQLDNAREDDREELEKELAELRASETERLQAIADKVHKAVADLTKLDTAAQKHLTARTELVTRTSDAITKSHADATAAFDRAIANVNDTIAAVTRELAAAQSKALGEIDSKFADRTAAALAAIEAATAAARAAIPVAPIALPPAPPATPTPAAPIEATSPSGPAAPSAPTEVASPPKRPRKARREEPAPVATEPDPTPTPLTEIPAPAAVLEAPIEATAASSETSATTPALEAWAPVEPAPVSPPVIFSEPAPIPLETIPVVEPIAPPSADPFPPIPTPPSAPEAEAPTASGSAPTPTPSPSPEPPADLPLPPPAATPEPSSAAPVERPAKKRAARKPDPEPTADLPLDLGLDEPTASPSDDSQVAPADAMERVISSDGATRLIATAYIGIGNRLFIRGDGPGLSWEKGVPLQFVSIGKWRWETSEATAPISFKLYKNDDLECAALGRLTLDPGHQQEVTAKF